MRVALFKNSEVSFLQLLNDADVSYEKLYPAYGSVMASGTMIVLGQTAAIAGSMATIIVAWLKVRSSRKVIITLKDKQVVQLEGYSAGEVKELLQMAEQIAVIDTLSPNSIK
ncbi:hypothetical protein [Pseudomonas silensiensis]|uniref:hypothetical protein n=1 Tax=Pseudomonas silensiensis TaxID=2991049 RepID=UPI003D25572F